MDEYREITRRSWGSRIVGSFMGMVFGLVMFIGAFPLLWWNEGRSLDRIKTLAEGRGMVIEAAPEQADPANNGKLIHFSGTAAATRQPSDDVFGIRDDALKLRRTVEMYQWEEEQRTSTNTNLGGSETSETVYSYRKVWSEMKVDSQWFKRSAEHRNPDTMPYESAVFTAPDIHVGAFGLGPDFVKQLASFTPYPLDQTHYDALPEQLKTYFILNGAELFHGNPAAPEIGALRVRYSIVRPYGVSVVGKQDGTKLAAYPAARGSIALLENGVVDAAAMFRQAEESNQFFTWAVRVGGCLLMFIGLAMLLRPMKVLGDVIPLIGTLIGAGTGIFAFLTALLLSLLTVAAVWIFYRPVIGISLLLIAGLLLGLGVKYLRGRSSQKASPGLSNKNYTTRS